MYVNKTVKENLHHLRPKLEESRPKLSVVTGVREDEAIPYKTAKSVESKNPPTRQTNKSRREREYLHKHEVYAMVEAAKKVGRYGKRDSLMILMAYRHGLRAGELVNLKWEQVSFEVAKIHINRLKNGDASTQTLEGDELRALRELQRHSKSAYVFESERGSSLTTRAFLLIVTRAGEKAKLSFPVHSHQLRHAAGFALASKGVDTRAIQGFLGHREIKHTVVYTQLSGDRFSNFGKLL